MSGQGLLRPALPQLTIVPGPDFNITMANLRFIQDIFTDLMFLQPIHMQAKLLKDTLGDIPLYYYNYRYNN